MRYYLRPDNTSSWQPIDQQTYRDCLDQCVNIELAAIDYAFGVAVDLSQLDIAPTDDDEVGGSRD